MLSVIILTYNESIHLERCIRSLKPFASEIFVVDSFSTDNTVALATSLGAVVMQHKWVNYAQQFQWGLDNCPITTKWVMRMDADEYVEPELAAAIPHEMARLSPDITGIYLQRKVFFMGKWIKWGAFYPQILLRIWQHKHGRIEQRWMDEHIILSEGKTCLLDSADIVDDNLNNITWWIEKHNKYATREMVDMMNIKYGFLPKDGALSQTDDPQAARKRRIKEQIYSHLPLGARPVLYFIYRYFIRLGFLDGFRGFCWHFMQALWYRMLVDLKCHEFTRKLPQYGGDIKTTLRKEFGIDCTFGE